ncbi:MAG: acyl-CoA/acyl-ACP dehydrogenase [Dehalococcoidales bacterium]|nr:acyl-CoA/acyl-ACP dehydrogenase [Dehalococcoidales bacterium]
MDFNLTEEQKMLRKTARDFLVSECPSSLVREMADDEKGFPPQLWQKMVRLGWQGLVFPERYNGGGGSFLDLVILLEETGRALLPCPLSPTVMAGMFILECGSEEQKAAFLPGITNGDIIVSLALTEPSMRCPDRLMSTRAVAQNGGYLVNGTKLFVPVAHVADYLICAAGTNADTEAGGVTSFIIDAGSDGITYVPLKTMGRDKQYEVQLNNVTVPAGNILGEYDKGWEYIFKRFMPLLTVAQCAEMNGGAQKVIEMTVEYAKERVTFGRPLGSHQAIQHVCADMFIALESARVLAYEAAWKICQWLPCDIEVSMAKYKANECYTRIANSGIQVQGGVSIIIDHDLPLYYRRAKAAEITLGDDDYHLEQIARILLD